MKKIIPFLAFCLVATCNAELRTWTAVNGKEVEAEFVSNEKGIVKLKLKSGKVFEVPADKLSKEDNEFISYLAKPEGVNIDELETEFREGTLYLKGSDTPYTGKYYELYPSGNKQAEGNWKDGIQDGLFVEWYENGQKKVEFSSKDGKEDGLLVGWHENGQKSFEATYKDGKGYGVKMMWHENGQKMLEVNYKDGKEISEKRWDKKGEPVDSEEEAEDNEFITSLTKPEGVNYNKLEFSKGIAFLKGSDTPYTGKSVSLHANGQKETKGNFKDGKHEGLQTFWYENGQKEAEGNYKDGKLVGSRKYWNLKGEPVDFRGHKLKLKNNP